MRIEQLTFTRFIAAFAILVYHYGSNAFPFNNHYLQFFTRQSNIGVSYFFILSGFVMVIAYYNKFKKKSDIFRYYKNRIARIFPLYFFAILLTLIMLFISNRNIDVLELILNVFLIQSWIPDFPLTINGPGWSLSVEAFFYIVFPFIVMKFYKKFKVNKIIIFIILFWLISQLAHNLFAYSTYYKFPSKLHDFIYYFPPMHLNEFVIGNIIGILFLNSNNKKSKKFDLLIILSFIILIILLYFFFYKISFHNGLLAVVFAPIIFLISKNNGIISTFFNKKTLVFLGEISFGIYILQMPVFYYCKKLFELFGLINENIIFYSSVFILIIFSSITYIFVEKPLDRIIRNKF